MRRAAISIFVLAMLLTSLGSIASAAQVLPDEALEAISAEKGTGVYIVLLGEDPALAHADGSPGPEPGSSEARAREEQLRSSHDRALEDARVPSDAKLYDYTYAANGFAAALTGAEAVRLAAHPSVVALIPDEIRHLATDSSPGFLELNHAQGAWATGYSGEGVVVGVIDTGIWPEHPSFAAGGYGPPPAGFTSTACEFGGAALGAVAFNDDDADFACNGKLLSARAFGTAFHGGSGEGLDPGEFLSARDADGHGSHTAATAAGNRRVQASVLGADWGTVSGIAPRARIAVYKACWSTAPGVGGCSTADLVAAIDQAVADGVDVINYSIGSSSATLGPDDIAFLFAADAGVLVAAAAGSSGPEAATVGSPATVPWLTSVAAATQARTFQGQVTLGDGTAVAGVTITGGTDELPLVDAGDAGNPLCDPAVGLSSLVEGAIVVCERGVVARVEKSKVVLDHGGAGMILVNAADGESLDTDNHHVPALHVRASDGAVITDYLDTVGSDATAVLSGGVPGKALGGLVASFSSRGPNGLSGDILKPDLAAPGVEILAATTPAALLGSPGELFRAISGTSMASPHVAGVFALLRHAHPDWTPAMAKSALVTTARDDVWLEDGETPAEVFAMGGGYLWPGAKVHQRGTSFNPGLVYDAGFLDYAAFTCGAGLGRIWATGTCETLVDLGLRTDPSDLNVPSIGVAELVGAQTVTRSVTSVADKIRVFTAQVRAPAGFEVDVQPATLTLAPGETAQFTVEITRSRAPLGEWRFGELAWLADGYEVESPIAVRAVELSASPEVAGEGVSGQASFDLGFGYSGEYAAGPHGLVPAVTEAEVVDDDPENDIGVALASGVGVTHHTVTVPEGTAYVRVALFDELTDGNDDLDLYVFDPDGDLVDGSGSPTSAETVGFQPPEDGDYAVVVHGWETDGPESSYLLSSWVIPLEAAEAVVVTSVPATAEEGTAGTVTVEWSGLTAGATYLGAVSHTGPAGPLGLTVLSVDTGESGAVGPEAPAASPDG